MASISLPEICDRDAVTTLLPDLLAASGDEPLALDGGAVAQIGQPMLQLLLSAAKTGAGVMIEEPSEALRKAARLTGVEATLFGAAAQ